MREIMDEKEAVTNTNRAKVRKMTPMLMSG